MKLPRWRPCFGLLFFLFLPLCSSSQNQGYLISLSSGEERLARFVEQDGNVVVARFDSGSMVIPKRKIREIREVDFEVEERKRKDRFQQRLKDQADRRSVPPDPVSGLPLASSALALPSQNARLELTDLDLLWTMPSSYENRFVNGLFRIVDVAEKPDFYSVSVAKGDSSSANPLNSARLQVSVGKRDVEFVRQLVKFKGKPLILGGKVKRTNPNTMNFFLEISQFCPRKE
jgi:hypothetical protein